MYDSRCEDLAVYFLGERAPASAYQSLAQAIQDCIEEWTAAELAACEDEGRRFDEFAATPPAENGEG